MVARNRAVADVDQQAILTADLLRRLAALERLGHVHPGSGASLGGFAAGRNLLDNGMLKVAQHGVTLVSNNNNLFAIDRWQLLNAISSTFVNINATNGTTVPQALGSSRHFLSLQNTTFKTPLAAGDIYVVRQGIEGYRLEPLHWGTAFAEPVTLQYLLFATRAVTVAVQLFQPTATWRVNQLIAIPAGTSRIAVTFPGLTGYTIVPDNSVQLYADMWIAAGSTFNDGNPAHILGPAWSNTNTNLQIASGISNFWDQAGQQLVILEAQLEPGTVATPVENRPFADELFRCQRCFWKSFPYAVTPAQAADNTQGSVLQTGICQVVNQPALYHHHFAQPMRAAPTLVTYNPTQANANFRSSNGLADYPHYAGPLASAEGFYVAANTMAVGTWATIHATASAEI